jgi:hypothetical protein
MEAHRMTEVSEPSHCFQMRRDEDWPITCLLETITIVLQDFTVGLQDESFGRDLAAQMSLQSSRYADVENANFLKS